MVRKLVLVVAVLLGVVAAPRPSGASSDGVWDYRSVSVSGSYQSIVGNFAGDDADDILWYAPGSTPDSLWVGTKGKRGSTSFKRYPLTISSSYVPIAGDFAGDAHTDIVWYKRGTGTSRMWVSAGDGTFTGANVPTRYATRPYTLKSYNGGKDQIFWYDPSAYQLSHRSIFDDAGSGTETKYSVQGAVPGAKIVIGDWNGDGYEDPFVLTTNTGIGFNLYPDGTYKSRSNSFYRDYTPVTVYDVPRDGILFFGSGASPDAFWRGRGGALFTSVNLRDVDLAGRLTSYPFGVVLVSGRKIQDAVFYDDGTKADWYVLNENREMGDERPIVGDFDGDGAYDILWYAAGSAPDQLWYPVVPAGDTRPDNPIAGAFRVKEH